MAEKKYIGKPGKQDDPCWKGYEMVGMKKKGGRKVPNCVPEATDIIAKAKEVNEAKYKKNRKKDWTGAKPEKDAIVMDEKWMVKKGTEVVSTHKTKDEADVKAMKHPLYKVYAKEELELEEKRGLWDNIHAKRERIKNGSGERMRKPGSKGAPTDAALKASQTEAANPAQQAAIAIAMKKAGKKPKNEELEEAENKQYIEITHQSGNRRRVPVHPLNAKRSLKRYQDDPSTKSARIVSESDLPWEEDPKNPSRKVGERKDQYGNKIKNVAKHLAKKAMNVKEELGKDNEWGRPELRKKFAAMTPGQEGLAADKIPTFDPRYDDVTTQHLGLHPMKEGYLAEISARGAEARAKFQAKIQKTLNDPAKIAKAKKALAKKAKIEKEKEPPHLVMQLRKAVSIGSKVHFQNGEHHTVAPNHADRFMSKYNSAKSAIEKEALQKRAHKSHAEFMKTIAEAIQTPQGTGPEHDLHMGNGGYVEVGGQAEKPCTCDIAPANYPTPGQVSPEPELGDMNHDGMENEWDAAAIEADVTDEIENSDWDHLQKYYDSEEDENEDLEEAISAQGRLKKRFNAMRTKTRRNMARNMALKRIATPDVIKGRSIRAARRMVYKRILRNRDPSSVSAAEKARIEAQVKRMAPTVARLSIRLQQKERKIDQQRVSNRGKK